MLSMSKLIWISKVLFTHFTPVINNTVFFDSFSGQYNDNPRYISEFLHKAAPETRIVWAVSERCKELPPPYVHIVPYGSREHERFALNSEVLIDNDMWPRSFGFRRYDVPFIHKLIKKPNQLAISTWHGTPLKKIGKDQLKRTTRTFYTATDYCVSGCAFNAKAVGEAFFVSNRMRMYGMPRNDFLFRKDIDVVSLKNKLGLPLDKGILLYAPTFRDNHHETAFKEREIDLIKTALKKRFGKDFAFVSRAHHVAIKRNDGAKEENSAEIINGNIGEDMAEYLFCADVLLTDYSSSFFDYALTGKPCFLFTPDLDDFLSSRGVYLDIEQLPFSKARTIEELIRCVETFDFDAYREDLQSFLKMLGNVEDGHATERVVQDIVSFIHRRKKGNA